MYGGFKVASVDTTPSFWQKCKQSLPRLSETQAKVLSVVSQGLQCAVAGFLSYEASKTMNDPYRASEEPLGSAFYGPLSGALGMVSVATGVFLLNKCRKVRVVRAVAHPVTLAGFLALGGTIPGISAQLTAQNLYHQINDFNNEANQKYQVAMSEQQALIAQCKEALYLNRTAFTLPECIACDNPGPSWGQQGANFFWQARYESGFNQVICYDQLSSYQEPLWDKLANITSNATRGPWPCEGEMYGPQDPEYDNYILIWSIFNIATPLSIVVQTLNESCKAIKGSGTNLFFPGDAICSEYYSPNLSSVSCATPALEEFGRNYSQFYFVPVPPIQESFPGQVQQIVETDILAPQIIFGTIFSVGICFPLLSVCASKSDKKEKKPLISQTA